MLMQQRLDNHIEEFNAHCEDEKERWIKFMEIQQSNTESIKQLVKSNTEICDSTRDIIEVWQAASGTVKTLSAFGRFVKWISGFAVLGFAFNWFADWMTK